ncbi:hypothetical protein [Rhodomicrobium lacus]|uniref:hypothetical protein n=1 Tax=Rhodomicrobium lacus TaxID=2498452 RepID=UPI000F8F42F1|nr:hypothetical protein [Rhodomicrobium lacus]
MAEFTFSGSFIQTFQIGVKSASIDAEKRIGTQDSQRRAACDLPNDAGNRALRANRDLEGLVSGAVSCLNSV